MQKRWSGFGTIEALIACVVVGALTLGGIYVQHRQSPTYTWVTYKSSQSSIHFKYPQQWKLTDNTKSIDAPDWLLENIDIQSPNNFNLIFEVYKPHVSTDMLCVPGSVVSQTRLANGYDMVLQGADASRVDSIFLMAKDNANYKGGKCSLVFYPNSLGSHKEFVFHGSYSDLSAKPAKDFLAQPEVKTAQEIFDSFRH